MSGTARSEVVAPQAAPAEGTGAVRSVRRALAILRAFTLTDRALSLGEIARRAGLDKATARRLLMTLMDERLIEQNPETKTYALSLGVLELAAGLRPREDLRQRAQPVLAGIAQATDATVFLGVVHDQAALCINRVDGGQAIQIRAWSIGGRLPLHCGAGPRVLMAHRPEAELRRLLARPLEALTSASPVEPGALAAILARIRERGWELAVDDVVEGISGLGVPVRDRSGEVIAAISISGLHAHILENGKPRHLAILQAKAQELERAIG
jgi:DNA-binding IclR family transcriptional regulator